MVFRQRSYSFIIALNPYSKNQGLIYLRFSDFDSFTLKLKLIGMKSKQKECFLGYPENYRLLDTCRKNQDAVHMYFSPSYYFIDFSIDK